MHKRDDKIWRDKHDEYHRTDDPTVIDSNGYEGYARTVTPNQEHVTIADCPLWIGQRGGGGGPDSRVRSIAR